MKGLDWSFGEEAGGLPTAVVKARGSHSAWALLAWFHLFEAEIDE